MRDSMRRGTVAYVLKGFPRLSETFIASEIYRLERRGLPLRLFVLKQAAEPVVHSVSTSIEAPRVFLPQAAAISDISLWRWLSVHAGRFAPSLRRQFRRNPARTTRAASQAFAHAVRARKSALGWPRKSPLKEFLQAAALADAIHDAGDVRHIHAHFCHSATTVAWLASIMTALPMSFTAHAKDLYCDGLNPAGLLDRKLRAARFVVTCTDAARRFLQARTSTPVRCVYHGLDVEFARMCDETAPARRPEGAVNLLSVGRLVRKKGHDVLIEACALLRRRGLAIRLRIVGESDDQEDALRELVAARRLQDCVEFAGVMSRADLFQAYMRADVFCLPCRVLENGDRDGIPNVVAEAMACRVPVVTTTVSGLPELLDDGVHGMLVPPDDPAAVADAIARLHEDPALRRQITSRARARIREVFDGDASVRALSEMLERGAA
jgi:glycosyltransferase involved in cell wall biosynthesis